MQAVVAVNYEGIVAFGSDMNILLKIYLNFLHVWLIHAVLLITNLVSTSMDLSAE